MPGLYRVSQGNEDSILVIEEYDKLSCPTRAMFRQFLQHPDVANITLQRTIVLMESNLGMTDLEQLLTAAKDRSKVRTYCCSICAAFACAGCSGVLCSCAFRPGGQPLKDLD